MKDSAFLPAGLLGNGHISHAWDNYPLPNFIPGFRTYFLANMGYHLHCTLQHAIDHVRHDYVEMMLHHIVTLFLMSFSYMLNMQNAGATVLFLHDIADIFTCFVRCICETTLTNVTLGSVACMLISWFYTRLLMLPYIISILFFYTADIYHGKGFWILKFLCVHLSTLFILHMYWFYLMVSAIQKFAKSGKLQEPEDDKLKK